MNTPQFDPSSHRLVPESTGTTRTTALGVAGAIALLIALAWGGGQVLLQVRMAPGTVLPAGALAPNPDPHSSDMRPFDRAAPASGPAWRELTALQKQALGPLAERWPFLSELQKRRWLVLAQNFPSLPAPEQGKLHERMTEWASLSAQQRSQARLNFATANQLAPDDKRAQWEAYQALSAEEKHRLATVAGPRPTGAATALRPVPARKLAQVPAATASNANPLNPPKIPPVSGHSSSLRSVLPVLPSSVVPSVPPMEARPPIAPIAPEPVVETAPVSIPTAEPLPLPPLVSEPIAHPSSPDTPASH